MKTKFNLSVKISRKLFQKVFFAYLFILIVVIFENLYFAG